MSDSLLSEQTGDQVKEKVHKGSHASILLQLLDCCMWLSTSSTGTIDGEKFIPWLNLSFSNYKHPVFPSYIKFSPALSQLSWDLFSKSDLFTQKDLCNIFQIHPDMLCNTYELLEYPCDIQPMVLSS
ncbi:hypothetical protein DFS33DRAFT_1382395 [Desarmillaria ectypa]|nr:hypothetical protein DFS33DRAFT_1382395 [Desarmillaria ectypa]